MKNFWIAIVLLTLAVALTALNSFAVRREVGTLAELACGDTASETAARFEKAEPFLSLSANHNVLEQAQIAVSEMTVYESASRADYLAARERFLAFLAEVEEGEKFSISNIF